MLFDQIARDFLAGNCSTPVVLHDLFVTYTLVFQTTMSFISELNNRSRNWANPCLSLCVIMRYRYIRIKWHFKSYTQTMLFVVKNLIRYRMCVLDILSDWFRWYCCCCCCFLRMNAINHQFIYTSWTSLSSSVCFYQVSNSVYLDCWQEMLHHITRVTVTNLLHRKVILCKLC